MKKITKLLNQKNLFENAYSNIHRWMTGEKQLEMHQNATDAAISFNERAKVVENNLKKSNIRILKLYAGEDVDLRKFAKYIIKIKTK
jgi:hypothetical protein